MSLGARCDFTLLETELVRAALEPQAYRWCRHV